MSHNWLFQACSCDSLAADATSVNWNQHSDSGSLRLERLIEQRAKLSNGLTFFTWEFELKSGCIHRD
jgi:hypothetical protein